MNHMVMIFGTYLKRTNSFFRFLAAGVINTIVGLSVMYFLLDAVGFTYWVATFAGNMTGAAVSYFLNRTFTFASNVPVVKGIFRFAAVILVCYYLSYSFSRVLASWAVGLIPISEKDFAVLMGTVIYTILNYIGQKYLVFSKKTRLIFLK